MKVITNCVRCCLDCFHRFVKFLNDNAYIQIALTGENFCTSAMQAFVLALKNAATFVITNGVGTLLHLLGKACICIGNVFLGYLIIHYSPEFDELDSPIAPLVVVMVMSFLMANVFMEVYGVTSLAVLQCLYTDVDICNQNKEDPMNNGNRPEEMEDIIKWIRK